MSGASAGQQRRSPVRQRGHDEHERRVWPGSSILSRRASRRSGRAAPPARHPGQPRVRRPEDATGSSRRPLAPRVSDRTMTLARRPFPHRPCSRRNECRRRLSARARIPRVTWTIGPGSAPMVEERLTGSLGPSGRRKRPSHRPEGAFRNGPPRDPTRLEINAIGPQASNLVLTFARQLFLRMVHATVELHASAFGGRSDSQDHMDHRGTIGADG